MYKIYNCSKTFYYDGTHDVLNIYEKKTFKIEELDLITSAFGSMEYFKKRILKEYNKDIDFQKLIIVHNKKDRLFFDDMIFDDKLIFNTAKEIISKKKQRSNCKEKIVFENGYVEDFIDYIKNISCDDCFKDYLFDVKNAKDLTRAERISLDNCFDKKGYGNTNRNIRYLLQRYSNGTKFFYDSDDRTYHKAISDNIDCLMMTDYRTIRGLVSFENKLLNILCNKLYNGENSENKDKYLHIIGTISKEKAYRNGLYNYNYYDTFCSDRNEENTISDMDYSNNYIFSIYQDGGVDSVMKYVDIDDIYGNRENYNTAVSLGVVKQYTKK